MVDKVTKTLNLNDYGFQQIAPSQRTAAKNDIGELIVREILGYIQDGNSPVGGYRSFKKLSKKYAKEEKGGNTNPNLELEGDMLNALKYELRSGSEIEFGIFDRSQAPKADGHNNFSGDSKLPLRRFIPDRDETLKKSIEKRIETVINDYASDRPESNINNDIALELASSLATGAAASQIDINDLFSADFFDGLF